MNNSDGGVFEREVRQVPKAAHQRNEVLTVTAEQALRSSKELLVPIPLDPADATGPKLDHQANLHAAHIMKILREGGYDCEELVQRIANSVFSQQN